jgi:transcriptional regulator with XRE-family HTH domain
MHPVTQDDAAVSDLRPALGARIRERRRRLSLSQEELSEAAKLHWTYLSDLERGEQTPTLDVVNRLAGALGVTLAEFFAPFDKPFKPQSRRPRKDYTSRRSRKDYI